MYAQPYTSKGTLCSDKKSMACVVNEGGTDSAQSVRSGNLTSTSGIQIPAPPFICCVALGHITYSLFASIFPSPKWGLIIQQTSQSC